MVLGVFESLFVDLALLISFELGVCRVVARVSCLFVFPLPITNVSTAIALQVQWLLEGKNHVHRHN